LSHAQRRPWQVRCIDKHAVFELTELLAGILETGVRSSSQRHPQVTPLSLPLPSMPVFQRRAP
jgi:hypothetical protein